MNKTATQPYGGYKICSTDAIAAALEPEYPYISFMYRGLLKYKGTAIANAYILAEFYFLLNDELQKHQDGQQEQPQG